MSPSSVHRGVMLHGRTGEKYIDHADYLPIFDKAAALGVPIHLHPQRPVKEISDRYYMDGMPEILGRVLSMFGWGWHVETAVNVIRLITSGALERDPAPQFIIGHWGELIPFFLERIDHMVTPFVRDAPPDLRRDLPGALPHCAVGDLELPDARARDRRDGQPTGSCSPSTTPSISRPMARHGDFSSRRRSVSPTSRRSVTSTPSDSSSSMSDSPDDTLTAPGGCDEAPV